MTDAEQRYLALAHAIQTGVACDQGGGSDDGSPKHLRTGINLAMCDIATLTSLLIEKGVFTLEEFKAKQIEFMEKEVKTYEQRLSKRAGMPITIA